MGSRNAPQAKRRVSSMKLAGDQGMWDRNTPIACPQSHSGKTGVTLAGGTPLLDDKLLCPCVMSGFQNRISISRGIPCRKRISQKKMPQKSTKRTKSKNTTKNMKIPENCPFRPTSSYAKVWTLLRRSPAGIGRDKLLAQLKKVSAKEERLLKFDISVVCSSLKTGESHRSIARKADFYYVEKRGDGFLRLHLRK